MRKKVISLILTAVMFVSFSAVVFADSESAVIENEPSFVNTLEYGFLNSLNVLPENTTEIIKFKRGEAAYIAANLYYKELTDSFTVTEVPFGDVSVNHIYSKEISVLKAAGVVNGSDSNFRPDDYITAAEAVAIIIRAVGYDVIAKTEGEYPTGYFNVANTQGVLRGVVIESSYMDAENMLKAFYNSLFMNIVVLSEITDEGIKIEFGNQPVITSLLNITLWDAVITNNGISSIDNTVPSDDGRIGITSFNSKDKITVNNSYEEAYLYLGVRVNAFVKYNNKTDEYTMVYFSLHNNVEEKLFTNKNIIRIYSDYVEYELDKNEGKYHKQYFNSNKPYVIINGVYTPVYQKTQLNPEDGFVKFIDNDGDNKTDVIRVADFSHSIYTDRISENTIYCKDNGLNSLDLSDDNKTLYRIVKNNSIINIEDINIYDVVSVASNTVDGKKFYELYVSSESIAGKTNDTEDNYIRIEDKYYLLSDNFIKNNSGFLREASNGAEGTFRLNVLNEIEFFDKGVNSDINYAYIIDIAKENSFDGNTIIKFYSLDGEFVTAEISENVKIDGERLDGYLKDLQTSASQFDEIRELLCVRPDGSVDIPTTGTAELHNKKPTYINPRLAIVKLNTKNEVISVDTDAPTYEYGELVEDMSRVLIADLRYPKVRIFLTNSIDGSFLTDSDTLCFKVPDIDRYGLMDGKYAMTYINSFEQDITDVNNFGVYSSSSYLKSGTNYDIQAYNVDQETGIADFVLVRGEGTRQSASANFNLAIFLRMNEYYDSIRQKQSYKLYYFQNGEEQSAVVDKDYLHEWYRNLLFGGKYAKSILNPGTMSEMAFYENVPQLKSGDIIGVEKTGSYATLIGRDLDLNRIYDKKPVTGRAAAAESVYSVNAWSDTAVTIPFDEYKSIYDAYDAGLQYELAVPLSIKGNTMKTALTYDGTTKATTLRSYIESGGTDKIFTRYVQLANNVSITVIEEEACNSATDNCSFKIRKGSLNDIKIATAVSPGEFRKASKVYYCNQRGSVREIVIMNLLPEHY